MGDEQGVGSGEIWAGLLWCSVRARACALHAPRGGSGGFRGGFDFTFFPPPPGALALADKPKFIRKIIVLRVHLRRLERSKNQTERRKEQCVEVEKRLRVRSITQRQQHTHTEV